MSQKRQIINEPNLFHTLMSCPSLCQHQPTSSRAKDTRMPVVYVQQLQQPALVGAFGSRRPARSVILFQQPQQLATAGSHGTGMPAATVILFQQPQKLALGRDFGTELPAPSTAHFQQPQQLAIVWFIKTHATKFTSLVLASSPNSKLAPRAQLQPSSDKFTSSPGITSKSLTVDYAPNSPPQPFTSTALYSPHFRLLISQTTPLYSTKQTKTNQSLRSSTSISNCCLILSRPL